jgi:hypothetical protein
MGIILVSFLATFAAPAFAQGPGGEPVPAAVVSPRVAALLAADFTKIRRELWQKDLAEAKRAASISFPVIPRQLPELPPLSAKDLSAAKEAFERIAMTKPENLASLTEAGPAAANSAVAVVPPAGEEVAEAPAPERANAPLPHARSEATSPIAETALPTNAVVTDAIALAAKEAATDAAGEPSLFRRVHSKCAERERELR